MAVWQEIDTPRKKEIEMQNKLKKYTEERNKIAARMAALEERRKALDAKIVEAENPPSTGITVPVVNLLACDAR